MSCYRFAMCFMLMAFLAPSLGAQEFVATPFIMPVGASADGNQTGLNIGTGLTRNFTASGPSSERWWPRPYIDGSLSLSQGGGYSPAAGTLGGGLNAENDHFIFFTEAYTENAHKLDSETGSERGIQARSFIHAARGWFFGGGVQWSKLSTIAYTKQAWRPVFGGGKDLVRENFSMRAQVLYVLPGSDHLNALQGPEFSLWLPSPSSKSHLFYRQTIGIYEFHQTSVPGNSGTSERSAANFIDFTILYRL